MSFLMRVKIMNTKQKKALYESIMKNVSKTIKKQLNESDNYDTTMYKRINDFFNNGVKMIVQEKEVKSIFPNQIFPLQGILQIHMLAVHMPASIVVLIL